MKLSAYHQYDLNDSPWNYLKGLLPPQKTKTGRPFTNHRQVINGILWIFALVHLGVIYLPIMAPGKRSLGVLSLATSRTLASTTPASAIAR